MPLSKNKRRRRDSSDEEEDVGVGVVRTAPVERKPAGVSAEKLEIGGQGQERKGEAGKQWGVQAGGQPTGADIAEIRMEEYLQAELKAAFDEGEAAASPTAAGAQDQSIVIPAYLQTQAIAEVSVPGFNTAITEFELDSEGQPGEIGVATQQAAGKRGGVRDAQKMIQQPVAGLVLRGGKPTGKTPFVPRDQFPASFGKAKR